MCFLNQWIEDTELYLNYFCDIIRAVKYNVGSTIEHSALSEYSTRKISFIFIDSLVIEDANDLI